MSTDLTTPEVLKESARMLYVFSGQSCLEIGKALRLLPTQIEIWKKEGNWVGERSNELKATIIELRDRALERVLQGSEGFQKNISALLDKTIASLLSDESSSSEEKLKKLERLWHLGKEVYGIDIAREAAKAYIQGNGNGVTYQNMMQINNTLLNAAVSDRVQKNISQVTDLA